MNLPHVTQLDEADITELEGDVRGWKGQRARRGIALTPLAFVMHGCVAGAERAVSTGLRVAR